MNATALVYSDLPLKLGVYTIKPIVLNTSPAFKLLYVSS